jgi:L-threonylcarbamoyladenylate synthase
MVLSFHSQPEEILVAIGPHIRKCHYWLEKQTRQNLKNTKFKKYFISKNKKIYFDLTKLAFDELLGSGIKRKNIEDCQVCTFCHFKKYFSARKGKQNPKIYSDSKNIHSSPSFRVAEAKVEKNKSSSTPPFAAARVRNPRFASFIGFQTPQALRVLDRKSNGFIKKAAESVKKGEILVCPTDTVYGLIADAANKKAVERLFKIKKRNPRKPVPIFVKDIKMAKKLVYIDKNQGKFLKKVWPGKVTVVLKRKKSKIKAYGADSKTIALRIPNYRFLNILLEKLNRPLTGTSANVSGYPASTKIKEIIDQFKNKKHQPDLIIDAGNLAKGQPSAVIDLTGEKIKTLRKGEIKIYVPKN